MRKLQVTTKPRVQIAAEFAAVFKDIKPIEVAKPVTQAERLAPYRSHILKQRRRGLTWKQIAEGMSGPIINEKVSFKLLRRLFAGQDEKPKSGSVAPISASKSGQAAG